MFVLRPGRFTAVLLAVNILLFIIMEITGLFGLGNLKYVIFGAQFGPLVSQGDWFRLITAMYVHGGLLHLFFNMYALYYLGTIAEQLYGEWKFFALYTLTGVVGNLASMLFYYGSIVLGASGALFGMAGMLVVAGFRSETSYYMRNISISLIPMILFNIIYGFIPGSHINNAAHLGGFLMGLLLGWLVPSSPYSYYYSASDMLKQLFSRQLWTNPWYRRQRREIFWVLLGAVAAVLTVLSFFLLIFSDLKILQG